MADAVGQARADLREPLPHIQTRVAGWTQFLCGFIGFTLLLSGAIAVFKTTNSAGAGALVAAGAALVVLAMFANRIRSIEALGMRLEVTAAAVGMLAAAQQAESEGRTHEADLLREEASVYLDKERLFSAAEPLATKFEEIRRTRPSSWDRTVEQERLIAAQARVLGELYADKADVEALFDNGSDGNRISAIAVMQYRPELGSARVVRQAVLAPRSAFEQYHGLKSVETMLATGNLELTERDALRQVIRQAMQADTWTGSDGDRQRLAERLLSKL